MWEHIIYNVIIVLVIISKATPSKVRTARGQINGILNKEFTDQDFEKSEGVRKELINFVKYHNICEEEYIMIDSIWDKIRAKRGLPLYSTVNGDEHPGYI